MLISKCKEKHAWADSPWDSKGGIQCLIAGPLIPWWGEHGLASPPATSAAAPHASFRTPFFCLRNNWKLGSIMRSSGINSLTSTPDVPPDEVRNTWGFLIDSASWRSGGMEWECRATGVRRFLFYSDNGWGWIRTVARHRCAWVMFDIKHRFAQNSRVQMDEVIRSQASAGLITHLLSFNGVRNSLQGQAQWSRPAYRDGASDMFYKLYKLVCVRHWTIISFG